MDPSDPDRLALSKNQLLIMIDEFIKELNLNKKENWVYIIESFAVRKLLARVPEDKFQYFWGKFWDKADQFRFANTVLTDATLQKLPQGKKIISELDFSIEKVLTRRSSTTHS